MILTKQKSWGNFITGTSTSWANLPAKMALGISTTVKSDIIVYAHMSRVQHFDGGHFNTQFRILIGGKQVALTNTGGSYGFGYDAINFQGLRKGFRAGKTRIEVEYRTVAGTVGWFNDQNGSQERRLIVMAIPSA